MVQTTATIDHVTYREPGKRVAIANACRLITNFGVFIVSQHPTIEQWAEYIAYCDDLGMELESIVFKCEPIYTDSIPMVIHTVKTMPKGTRF